MKTSNKREPQQNPINHSSDVDFKDFMYMYTKIYCKTIVTLVNDTILPSDYPLRFKKKH